MNEKNIDEPYNEIEKKVQSIILAHLFIKKRERQEKVSLQELEEKVSLQDKSYLELDLIKLWNNSNLVVITDDNQFSITELGMTEEERRIKENKVID